MAALEAELRERDAELDVLREGQARAWLSPRGPPPFSFAPRTPSSLSPAADPARGRAQLAHGREMVALEEAEAALRSEVLRLREARREHLRSEEELEGRLREAAARAERAEALLGGAAEAEATLELVERQAGMLAASVGRRGQRQQVGQQGPPQAPKGGPAARMELTAALLRARGRSEDGAAAPTGPAAGDDDGDSGDEESAPPAKAQAPADADALRRALAASEERARIATEELGSVKVPHVSGPSRQPALRVAMARSSAARCRPETPHRRVLVACRRRH